MWNAPVIIFEDEDEDAMKANFVVLQARYPNRDKFEITNYIFKNLVDGISRANQAAMIWSQDLDILERIRLAILNDGVEPNPIDTQDAMLRKIEGIYNSVDTPVKERIAAMRLHAEMSGRIVKSIEKTIDDGRRGKVPTFVIAQYADE